MVHLFSDFFPLYVVNEYPKSGGTWLSQMLSEALGVPFPRQRLPVLKSSIMHGHYIRPGNISNMVILWRDGRDVLISQYYHSLFQNETENTRLVNITQKNFNCTNCNDIVNNLYDFIDYTYNRKITPKFSWADFAAVWAGNPNAVHVKYEDLRREPASELRRVYNELTGKKLDYQRSVYIAEKYSFARMSGRSPGEENARSFMRKGVIGDWKNYFTSEAKFLFDQVAGESLINLGYERDHSWIYD